MVVSITYGSFNLNNNASGYYVTEKPFSLMPVVETFYKVARLEGQKRTAFTINERQMQLKMLVVSTASPPTRTDLENKLSTLYQNLSLSQQNLTMYSVDSRYVVCDCIGADAVLQQGNPISAAVTLTFVAQQPYFLASTSSSHDGGSHACSLISGSNYSYPQQTFSGGGNVFSRPSIKVTKQDSTTWSGITITQNTDAIQLGVTTNLPTTSGTFMQFNCDPTVAGGYSVLLNNTGSPTNFTGTFPVQESGSTIWNVTITASGVPTADILWTWTARWA